MCRIVTRCRQQVTAIRQATGFSCPYAAAKMVMLACGDRSDLPGVERGITNNNDLIAFLQLAGLKEIYDHPPARRMQHFFADLFDNHGPIIADIQLSAYPGLGSILRDWTHWIVIIGITNDDRVAYLDPSKDGVQYMSFYDLEQLLLHLYARG